MPLLSSIVAFNKALHSGTLFLFFLLATVLPSILTAQLASPERIVIGIGNNYPPYSYLDEDGIDVGYNFDIARAIAAVTQQDFEIRVGPWTEIRMALENGEIDAIAGMLYSEERDKILDFSAPYTRISQAIFTRNNVPTLRTELDLVGKRIIVQRGDIMHDYVLKNRLDQNLTVVESQTEALGLLATGDHDLALLAQLSGLHYRNELGLNSIKTTGPLLMSRAYGFAVQQGNTGILHLINEGLATLSETGGHKTIYDKWLGSLSAEEDRITKIWKTVALIVGPVIALMLLLLLWSRILRRQVEQRTNDLLNQSQITTRMQEGAMLIRDSDTTIIYANPALEEMYGYEQGEMVGKSVSVLNSPNQQDPQQIKEMIASGVQEHGIWSGEIKCVRKDGSEFAGWVTSSAFQHPIHGEVGVTINRDITEQKLMGKTIIQAQKMESIGTMTGGVAHDFNNLLAVIMGRLELAVDQIQDKDAIDLIEGAIAATLRGAALTQNMLSFASKAHLEPELVDLNDLVAINSDWMTRTIPATITVKTTLLDDLWKLEADVASTESALLNLLLPQ